MSYIYIFYISDLNTLSSCILITLSADFALTALCADFVPFKITLDEMARGMIDISVFYSVHDAALA